ncbi:peptidoglycan-recognition protein LA-like isoform X2 [Teleopsis dalmanni]|uniref:peptidoglycan-recognition protein LA-like isoform X1 n=1 Tax=Teleopsis dalmanni TaxID=139649 RepID=UPI0018CE70C2|nr:peptidoglycan-recognition protein LA-like isoform X1 [Teleopsis dalmanni]XP_037937338.1 peptidoglycan-recognition protein LA-like isoform X2 [Teleopsis dalmanni]XP_037939878.1 peptidoglycan-recognition protein LA-like isoform X2 [Teleopsis dalmanni]
MKLLLKVNSEKTRKRHRWNSPETSSKTAVTSLKRINQNRNASSTSITQKLTITSKLLILLIVLLIILIIASVVVYFNATGKKETGPILFGNNYEHGTFPNLGNGHLIVDRIQWGASELAKKLTIPLKHPIPYVLITHIGVQSVPCLNIYKCSIKMRTIQDSAIAEKNLPDIQANFYVGDDGNIYVGRGWDYANTYANDTLAVTFMGDYGRYIPSDKQLEATQFLLAHAKTSQYIDLAYKLVAQNQTKSSKSPGANVYRYIKNWPHFYPCGMDDNPKCGSELGMPEKWDGNM